MSEEPTEAVVSSGGIRQAGALPLHLYGALGDGRAVALSGADGSIDWWCVPNMDSPALFGRLLDEEHGGRFVLQPDCAFTVERTYRADSNVLESTYSTAGGRAKLTESLNSGSAGPLPWAELARRLDGIEGLARFTVRMRPGRRGNIVSPYHSLVGKHRVFHVERVQGLFIHDNGVSVEWSDEGVEGEVSVKAGQRSVMAVIAGRDEPLIVPSIEDIDRRIDGSDKAWREWCEGVRYDGADRGAFVRSALALKLLLYSPTGAIVAAATTSLPERIRGKKNYEYRYAWIRDAGYTIKAFLTAGLQPEAKAALTWLLEQLRHHGAKVVYTLGGDIVPTVTECDLAGYRGSLPVVTGNAAAEQRQHGVYGDSFINGEVYGVTGGAGVA